MEFTKCIETRASVRQFAKEPVPAEDLKEMVRLAGLAPSVNNWQPWKFIAITNHDLVKTMADAVHNKVQNIIPAPDATAEQARAKVEWFSTFFVDAPAVIVVLKSPYQAVVDEAIAGSNLSHDEINAMRGHPDLQSIGAAIEHLLLAANDKGYGACWLSGPQIARRELEGILGVEEPWTIAAMVAVGKPAGPVHPREKRSVDEIFELRA